MPLQYLEDSNYTLGMIRDVPSWLIPPGGFYDCSNMVFDRPGVARMRMGTTAVSGSSQTAFMTSLGFVYSQDGTPIEELYGLDGKAGGLVVINKSTGATTSLGTLGFSNAIVGRTVRHFGVLYFPCLPPAGSNRVVVQVAGQTTNTTFTSATAVTITANAQQITLAGADTTTNIKVGGIVVATDVPATTIFRARVVSVDSSTKFTVWPRPPVGFATSATGLVVTRALATNGGVCGASYQNRLLWGNTNDLASTGQTLITDRRVYYSPLPTEPSVTATTQTYGATFMSAFEWPAFNFFEVPGIDPIVALEPVNDNQLLVLTATRPVVVSGNLTTQTGTTSPTITFDITDVGGNAGCLSDLSVQRTNRGVIWAGGGGIYAWDGSKPVDLTDKKINTYWRDLALGSNFAIHGSAYARGHYIISGSSGGATFALMCNLTNLAWTRLSGATTDVFHAVQRPNPAFPGQVWAARWWDQTGAAPSLTGGQTIRLETMLNQYVSGTTTDADTAGVAPGLTTRVLTGDPETQKLFQRLTVRSQLSGGTLGGLSITAQSKIDAADIDASSVRTLGTLSNTDTWTITAATNATPIVLTTSASALLTTDDFIDVDGVLGNLNANGRWRIFTTGGASITLVGSSGSGAYTSGGTLKRVTEKDYLASVLNAGQGVSVSVSTIVGVNKFEFHGVRVAFAGKAPVMSA